MRNVALQALLLLGLLTCAVGAGQPIVSITKSCPDLRYLGRDVTFEITVTNRGDGPALNVVVRDTVTGGLQFLEADSKGVREGDVIVWHLGTLEAGQARTLKTTMRCNQIGKVTNSATVSYCAEEVTSCAFEVKGIPAILLECVDDPDPTEVGGMLTYTITVLNQGSALGTNIAINCTLPPEEEYVSSSGPTAAKVTGKAVSFAPLPSLASKATAVFTVKVKGIAVGDVRFRVEMTSDQLTRPVMETESTHIY
jgi:uncharacterized repeat protein (TIGR01451 family)